MRETRSIIGNKGLITLPKEWRDIHNLTEKDSIESIYKLNGVLIIKPENKQLSEIEEICINILEKGITDEDIKPYLESVEQLREILASLK